MPSCASVTSSGITSNMPVYRKLPTTPLGKATISTGSVLFATEKSWLGSHLPQFAYKKEGEATKTTQTREELYTLGVRRNDNAKETQV